jgi:hypothetical protein
MRQSLGPLFNIRPGEERLLLAACAGFARLFTLNEHG